MAQVADQGSEFKPQYHPKKKKEITVTNSLWLKTRK
jgi:hypothetical protein